MTDLQRRLAELSPEQREILERRLQRRQAERLEILQGPELGEAPLSFGQERLWFLDQLRPEARSAYHVSRVFHLHGPLAPAALAAACSEVARRHPILRTIYRVTDGVPRQVTQQPGRMPLPVVDLTRLPTAAREDAALHVARRHVFRPFDLATGPVWRSRLIRLSPAHHLWSFAVHHIAFDGPSLDRVLEELVTLYRALRQGREAEFPTPTRTFADFARWQRKRVRGAVVEDALDHFRQRLLGAPRQIDLPADRQRSADRARRRPSGLLRWRLGEVASRCLTTCSRQLGVTPFAFLLTGLGTALARWSRQEDLVFGVASSHRDREELDDVVGFFVNTLTLRFQPSRGRRFDDLVRETHGELLDAYSHRDLPFERLVEELVPERSVEQGDPLLQVMVSYEESREPVPELEGLTVERVEQEVIGTGSAKVDLTVLLHRRDDCFGALIEYDASRFRSTAARRLAGHLERLLTGALEGLEQRWDRLSWLSPEQVHQVAREWSGHEIGIERETTLTGLFDARALERPEATALSVDGAWVTYGELARRSRVLAGRLHSQGVRRGDVVAVLLERGRWLVESLLAILEVGAAYLPLDPSYPAERLEWMLEDAGAAAALTRGDLVPGLPPGATGVVCVDAGEEDEGAGTAGAGVPWNRPGPEDLAYVIYTSGSTGRPKAVEVSHRAVVRLVREGRWADLAADQVFLGLAPISFDASTLELWGPLCNGGRLVLYPAEAPTLAELGCAIERSDVTTLWLTAGLFQQMIDEELDRLAGLRQLLAGGDALSPAHVRRVIDRFPALRMINGYGPTENTTFTTCHTISRQEELSPSVPIGRPIAGTEVMLLDRELQPVPIGTPGELYAGGAGLARGYRSRPAQTAERFVPHPNSSAIGARVYRTGDLARFRAEGVLEFLGRSDRQVKIRGFRIEPGEVESVLVELPEVRAAVVVPRGEGASRRHLVAYVVLESPAKGRPDEWLRRHLAGRLPVYMTPSVFVALDEMPLSPNGKIDRAALPAPKTEASDSGGGVLEARTPTEEILVQVWSRVLERDVTTVDADFFALGGHSLLATRVVSRVREYFRVELPLAALFDAPTPLGLAERIEAARGIEGPRPLPPVEPVDREQPLPLSHAQERLWFLDRLEPGSASYNMPVAVRLEGSLDRAALERSLTALERRHEALRTTFAEAENGEVQVIHPPGFWHLETWDETRSPETEAEVRRRMRELAVEPFDLERGPLARAYVVGISPETHVLLLVLHHVVADGGSVSILLDDLEALYEAFARGAPSPLSPPTVQYADFAVWQRRWWTRERLEPDLDFWRRQLQDVEPLDLPTDRPRPATQTFAGASERFHWSERRSDALRSLLRRRGITLYMAAFAALQALLARYGGQAEPAVGMPVSYRDRAELEGVVGFFADTLVLRGDVRDDPTAEELLERSRDAVLSAHAHKRVPFSLLVDELDLERDLSRTPLFQVLLTLFAEPGERSLAEGVTATLEPVETSDSRFDLTLALRDDGKSVRGILEYNTDLFDATTVGRMRGHFERCFEALTSNESLPMSRWSLLAPSQEQQLLVEWARGPAAAPASELLHGPVETRIRETPDAVAVVFGDQHLSFGELARRSNRWAHRLRVLGARPESRVGVYLERSVEMVVAILGILKSGAAYVPLDPGYPEEHLSRILEAAEPVAVIAEPRLAGSLPADVPRLSRTPDEGGGESPSAWAEPRNLAYVIFTSGSTGEPKGVQVPHRGAATLAAAFVEAFRLTRHDHLLMVPSMSFDASVGDLFPCLAAGATLYPHPDPSNLTGWALAELCGRYGLTVVDIPAAFWQQWLEDLEEPGMARRLAALRMVVSGGESVSVEQVHDWEQLCQGRCVFFGPYGPTEASVCSTFFRTDPGWQVRVRGSRLPIGRPVAGDHVYLVDRDLAPTPPGVAGEVLIGGSGVTRGYWRDARATAERFQPDPWSDRPGGRLYRTGDLGRWSSVGELVFAGRVDHQVKVRGFRIEPGEIEATLQRHPGVSEAVVAVSGEGTARRLVTWVVSGEAPERPDAAELRVFLGSRLPAYMVPAAFVFLPELPLTPSGKLDRRALPEPRPEASRTESVVRPRDETEEALFRVWQEVLSRDDLGVTDDFFELGGDSMASLRMVSLARREGLDVTVKQVFEHPTVEELARVARPVETRLGVDRGIEIGEVAPTPIQRWFFDLGLVDPHHFNLSYLLEISSAGDPSDWERALRELTVRHGALRLRVAGPPSPQVRLRIPEPGPDDLAFEVLDLSALGTAAAREKIETESARVQASLDLERGPLVRAALFDLGNGRGARLLLAVHHLAVDQVSWGILLEDLETLRQGREPAAPTTSLRRWAEVLEEQARAPQTLSELSYWTAPERRQPSALPVDFEPSEDGGRLADVAVVRKRVDAQTTEWLLEAVPAAYRGEVQHALLAALTRAVARWRGDEEEGSLLVEMEGHGRGESFARIDLSRTVGWLTVAYPLLLDPPLDRGPGETLRKVKEAVRSVPRQGLGYGLLRYGGDPEIRSRLAELPRPCVSFNYLGRTDPDVTSSAFQEAPESRGPDRSPRNHHEVLLEITSGIRNGRLELAWLYDETCHHRSTIESLGEAFVEELESLVEHCRSMKDVSYTPSDFPKAKISQSDLDYLIGQLDKD